MQASVVNPSRARGIDGARELTDEGLDRVVARRRVVPHGDVERLGGDVFLGQVGKRPLDAGTVGADEGGVLRHVPDAGAERFGQSRRLLGRDVQPKDLHRDEAIVLRVVRTKHGAENANTNLVKDAEGTECRRRRK